MLLSCTRAPTHTHCSSPQGLQGCSSGRDTGAGQLGAGLLETLKEVERERGLHSEGALFWSVRTSEIDTCNKRVPRDNFKDDSNWVSRNHNQSQRARIRAVQANPKRVSPVAPLCSK